MPIHPALLRYSSLTYYNIRAPRASQDRCLDIHLINLFCYKALEL